MDKWVLDLARKLPKGIVAPAVRYVVDGYASATPPRPHRYSTWSPEPAPTSPASPVPVGDYVAWPGLVDRSFTARHLGPTEQVAPGDPEASEARLNALVALTARPPDAMRPDPRASAMFCFFAQWFTDSFLRTSRDRRRTDSNHEIDLCQVYGLDETSCRALRDLGNGGRLKVRVGTDGRDYPPLLYRGDAIDPAFHDLFYLRDGRAADWAAGLDKAFGDGVPGPIADATRRRALYALGLDRGNSTILYSAINTVFIREHNRVAGLLRSKYPTFDDERLFQTARLITMRQLLTIVIEDYIAFIAGFEEVLTFDHRFAESKPWYRANRTSIEFNLLYRFHSMTPDTLRLGDARLPHLDYRYRNDLLEAHGVGRVLSDASATPAGRHGLFNTPDFLSGVARATIKMGRDFRLQPYNAYRERFGQTPVSDFDELSDHPETLRQLRALYPRVDEVDYVIGILAERHPPEALFGPLLTRMVGCDAFTHIYTNPMLATEVDCHEVYTRLGVDIFEERATFAELAARNCPGETVAVGFKRRA